ncbi:MAG: copper resistance protein CopC [Chloroflexi bacterium]|nr:copper resistance protein CopC [Chloroflexota bacterium]
MAHLARTCRVLAAVALAAVLGVGVGPPLPALAHAGFVSAYPAPGTVLARPPAEVRIWFSEEVEPRFSSIRVLDSTGARADAALAQPYPGDAKALVVPLAPLGDGIYTIAWQALSAVDGHTTKGSFTFAVGAAELAAQLSAPAPAGSILPPSLVEVLLRFLLFASAAATGGVIVFRYLVLLPAAAAARLRLTWDRAPDAVLRWGALTLLGAALGLAALRLAAAGPDALVATRVGLLLLARAGLAAALLALAWWAPRTWPQRSDIALVALLGVLLTIGLNSHNAAARGASGVAIILDYLHLLAMAAWSGGLAALLLFLITGLKVLPERERPRLLRWLLPASRCWLAARWACSSPPVYIAP